MKKTKIYDPLFAELEKLPKGSVVAIEGDCASGKTTLAELISSRFTGSKLIHMDSFFLPSELRTEARLSEPGGNIHYERFNREVALPLINDKSIRYGVFECGNTMDIVDTVDVGEFSMLIVEGSYSMHSFFNKYYNYSVFLEVDEKKQLERISRRSEFLLDRFISEWIPMEKRYQQKFEIKQKSDLVINTSSSDW